jgi:hypothetical protein
MKPLDVPAETVMHSESPFVCVFSQGAPDPPTMIGGDAAAKTNVANVTVPVWHVEPVPSIKVTVAAADAPIPNEQTYTRPVEAADVRRVVLEAAMLMLCGHGKKTGCA